MKRASMLLVGAGPMATAYAKVLQALDIPFSVVGRDPLSADTFEKEVGVKPDQGGLQEWLKKGGQADRAIVVVPEGLLGEVSLQLLESDVRSILIEKPGGSTFEDVERIAKISHAKKVDVSVGYNRRFYTSVRKAHQLIADDGGVSSFHFEFTELGYKLEKKTTLTPFLAEAWFFHNSTHVIDMAFYLGGEPERIQGFMTGSTSYRNTASKYAGAGITQTGAVFSYHSNWAAPGRWNVEILTPKNRYIFRPLEKLQVQKLGTMAIEEIPIEDELDVKFKPGVYRQVEAFLKGDHTILPTIHDQVKALSTYREIEKSNFTNAL